MDVRDVVAGAVCVGVSSDDVGELVADGDGSEAGFGFRWSDGEVASDLGCGVGNGEALAVQVEVAEAEGGEFAGPESYQASDVHEGAVGGFDCGGEVMDFL